jgi:hypothetical protein
MRASEHCISCVCVRVGSFVNVCFKVSGRNKVRVCSSERFLNDCLLFMYLIF